MVKKLQQTIRKHFHPCRDLSTIVNKQMSRLKYSHQVLMIWQHSHHTSILITTQLLRSQTSRLHKASILLHTTQLCKCLAPIIDNTLPAFKIQLQLKITKRWNSSKLILINWHLTLKDHMTVDCSQWWSQLRVKIHSRHLLVSTAINLDSLTSKSRLVLLNKKV